MVLRLHKPSLEKKWPAAIFFLPHLVSENAEMTRTASDGSEVYTMGRELSGTSGF